MWQTCGAGAEIKWRQEAGLLRGENLQGPRRALGAKWLKMLIQCLHTPEVIVGCPFAWFLMDNYRYQIVGALDDGMGVPRAYLTNSL